MNYLWLVLVFSVLGNMILIVDNYDKSLKLEPFNWEELRRWAKE